MDCPTYYNIACSHCIYAVDDKKHPDTTSSPLYTCGNKDSKCYGLLNTWFQSCDKFVGKTTPCS